MQTSTATQNTQVCPQSAVLLELLPDNTIRITKQGNTATLLASLERAFQLNHRSIQIIGG